MPKERLKPDLEKARKGPKTVYATLQDLVKLQLEARGYSFLPKYAVQSILSGKHTSKLRGRGLDFDDVRQYAIGDDIRNIDWKVTAKVGVTHTKVFTEERERPVFLIVDQSKSMFFGSQLYFKSVVASHLAALASWRTLQVSDRVGGIVFNQTQDHYVKPQRNRKAVQQFLSLISKYNHSLSISSQVENTFNPLEASLSKANQLITHDYLVVIISDHQKVNKNVIRQMIHLKKNNDVLFAGISDPLESDFNFDQIVVSDGIHRLNISKNSKLKEKFDRQTKTQELELKQTLRKYGIPYLPFSTTQKAVIQLRTLLSPKS